MMYSRNMRNGGRITLPPGYVGNAFPDDMTVKYHEPENEEESTVHEAVCDTAALQRREKEVGEQNALSDLIRTLRGRIGTEELIILLVMLLTSSEGVKAETVILALVLLAR